MIDRLLIVSEPGRDGVFVYVRSLVEHLHQHYPQVQVDLAYSSCRGSEGLKKLVTAIESHGGETVDLRVGNSPQTRDLRAAATLLAWVRRRRIQLVHAHSSKAGALARLCALVPGFPRVLYTPHAYFGMPRLGGRKEIFFNFIESVLGRLCQTHNCSEDERDFAIETLKLNPKSLHVIHNGIDTDLFTPADPVTKAAVRHELGLPPDGKLLVTVGRASTQKNYPPLYQALNKFLPGSGAWFAHAGDGSIQLRETLSPEARKSVFAFQYVEHPELLLRSADGFVLTSRYEGLSFSMIQGLSCGLPVILTDAPGLRVLKPLGFTGVFWLTDPAQPEEVKTALELWLKMPLPPGHEQRDRARRYFNERNQLEKIVTLYGELSRPSH